MNPQILLIEDHAELAATTGEFLEECGYTVDYAMDGTTGLNLALSNQYDALVIDVMLPGMDGFQICEKIRQGSHSDIPMIMLTARDQLEDKLKGFELGADDYLIKPFDFEELEARLIALIRRFKGAFDKKTLTIHDLELNPKTMIVKRQDKAIKLSPTCLHILQILMKQSPELVSKAQIERELWGDELPNSDVLRSHLYNLRQAIDKPFDAPLIQTVPGLGLKILPPE